MKIIFTKHAVEKFPILKLFGWHIEKVHVIKTIKSPKWRGISRFGQETAMSLVDDNHILRVILNKEDAILTIVTFHIARRGKYESTI